MDLCEGGSGELLYCYQNLASSKSADENKAKAACLNSHLMTDCKLIPLECTDRTVVLQTGVLIHSNSVIKAIYRTAVNNTKITEIRPNLTTTRVTYYPWKEFETVEFQDGFVSNPDTDHTIEFEIELTAPITWNSMVNRNQLQFDKLNTSKALNMLNETVKAINSGTLIHKYFGWNKLYMTLTMMSAAFWSIVLAYGIYNMLKSKSVCKQAYIKPRRKQSEHFELKNLDVERSEAQSPRPIFDLQSSTESIVSPSERQQILKRRRTDDAQPHKTIQDTTSDETD